MRSTGSSQGTAFTTDTLFAAVSFLSQLWGRTSEAGLGALHLTGVATSTIVLRFPSAKKCSLWVPICFANGNDLSCAKRRRFCLALPSTYVDFPLGGFPKTLGALFFAGVFFVSPVLGFHSCGDVFLLLSRIGVGRAARRLRGRWNPRVLTGGSEIGCVAQHVQPALYGCMVASAINMVRVAVKYVVNEVCRVCSSTGTISVLFVVQRILVLVLVSTAFDVLVMPKHVERVTASRAKYVVRVVDSIASDRIAVLS